MKLTVQVAIPVRSALDAAEYNLPLLCVFLPYQISDLETAKVPLLCAGFYSFRYDSTLVCATISALNPLGLKNLIELWPTTLAYGFRAICQKVFGKRNAAHRSNQTSK